MRHLCIAGVATIVLAAACSRADSPARRESTVGSSAHTVAPAAAKASDWDSDVGALLLVPSDSDNSAIVLYPGPDDESLPISTSVTLLNASGDTARALVTRTDSLECGDAPLVRLDGASSGVWSAGTVGRGVPTIRMDSIESLAAADSARLAADIARLASGLPMRDSSRFAGLPFAVVAARRFSFAGRDIIVAHLARRLNQEAQPLEERTFVIAERATGSSDRYSVAYHQRSEGTEDTAEHFDVLAGMRGRTGPILLIARDQLASTRYEILERDESGAWRVRWARTLSC